MAPLPSPVSPETLASIVAEQSPGRPDDPWLHLLPGRSMLALTFVLAVTVILSACTVSPVPGPSSSGSSSSGPTSSGPTSNEPTSNRPTAHGPAASKPTPADRAVSDPAGSPQALGTRTAPEAGRSAAVPIANPLRQRHGEHSTQPLPPPLSPFAPLPRPADGERYQASQDNPVRRVAEAPVSTFSIDVDTGSWSNVRRFLNGGSLPRHDAVRVEEMINYFPYDYPRPVDGKPFAVHTALAAAPWNPDRVLMRVAIKGEDRSIDRLPPANLVFLIDVSGSMAAPNKLALLQYWITEREAIRQKHDAKRPPPRP